MQVVAKDAPQHHNCLRQPIICSGLSRNWTTSPCYTMQPSHDSLNIGGACSNHSSCACQATPELIVHTINRARKLILCFNSHRETIIVRQMFYGTFTLGSALRTTIGLIHALTASNE